MQWVDCAGYCIFREKLRGRGMLAASTGLPQASYALTAGPVKAQNVFLGANVFMSGFGGHRCDHYSQVEIPSSHSCSGTSNYLYAIKACQDQVLTSQGDSPSDWAHASGFRDGVRSAQNFWHIKMPTLFSDQKSLRLSAETRKCSLGFCGGFVES